MTLESNFLYESPRLYADVARRWRNTHVPAADRPVRFCSCSFIYYYEHFIGLFNNYIRCLWDYDIRETLFFVLMETSWQYAVSVRRYVYCHVLLFIMANILFVYWINFILFLCHHIIRKQIFCFSIEGFLAVNWCCLSLKGPAYYRLLPSLE